MKMQQLSKRNTYTPPDIPQVRCNCGTQLNRPAGRVSAVRLKTLDNNPDAVLTAAHAEQGLRVPVVYVQSLRGKALMPTTSAKARRLLQAGKAVVVCRTPFTIKLNYATGESLQEIVLGIDSGYAHVGISAVGNHKELYSCEVQLRKDIPDLLTERRMYRRSRRSRKTWYRQPRFLNRHRDKGWIAPSLQNKVEAHLKAVKQVTEILPISKIVFEVGSFDTQLLENPEIQGVGYQQGQQAGFENAHEYVLYRDNHLCTHCKGKTKNRILQVHHIVHKSDGGSNRPDNLVTLCETCHADYHAGKVKLKTKISKSYKAPAFMNAVRYKIVDQLQGLNIPIETTFGYKTKSSRIKQGLNKSHINDAYVMAGGQVDMRRSVPYMVRQVRKSNRKLRKGKRSEIRYVLPRKVFGFEVYDKVRYNNIECFINGRRKTGYFLLSDIEGKKIKDGVNYKCLHKVESAKTFIVSYKGGSHSSPA